jgi:hypothetical protein
MTDGLTNPTTPAPAAPPAAAAPPAPGPRPSAPVTPGSKAWSEMTTEQRHAQLRGPENPRARGWSPARDQREGAATRAPGEAPPGEAPSRDQQPAAPAAQGEKVRVGEYEISAEELGAMMQRQAVDDQRRLTVPPSAEAYEAKLPADLKLPGDQTYIFNRNDPSLIAARNLAHSKGWSQQDFSEALGIFASHIAGQEAQLAERARAELEKVGVNAPQRVDAVGKWLDGFMGTKDAAPIRATICTDSHLRFMEAVMNKISSQGVASFSQSHRVAPDDNKIPGYEKMSFEQRRFAQDQRAARERGR